MEKKKYKVVLFDFDGTLWDDRMNKENVSLDAHPGMNELVIKLKKEGIKFGLITNGEKEIQERKLINLRLDNFLEGDIFYASWDEAEKSYKQMFETTGNIAEDYRRTVIFEKEIVEKPNHYMFEKAMKELGVSPEETLYVGNDFKHDIYAAENLKIDTCYIPGSNSHCQELKAAKKAHFVLGDRENIALDLEKIILNTTA